MSTRNFPNSTGLTVIAVCLVAVGHVRCDSTAAIALLCLAVTMRGVMIPGFYPSYTELTLGFSGVAYGISNSLANCSGFLAPLMVGILTDENQTIAAWQKVFYIGAAISVSGSVMALAFHRTDPVSWARDPDEDELSHPARDNMKVFAALVVVLTVALMAEVGHGWRRRGSAKLEGGKREEQGASWGQTRDKLDDLFEVLTEVEQKREEMAARGMDNDVDEVDEMGQFRDKKYSSSYPVYNKYSQLKYSKKLPGDPFLNLSSTISTHPPNSRTAELYAHPFCAAFSKTAFAGSRLDLGWTLLHGCKQLPVVQQKDLRPT
ncbi:SLC17A5 [Branchiostoma lanceolatum]|uniref:SLC17A5 protein n=1 Tax=Branchiostoma lanceolatum TaxID=7740 RepID=A0A8J9ZAB4_BRALA|nr:SLC17A5 [Branchiostoma lanceolatum]